MNEWYLGEIHNLPVWIFVSDDWQMDYLLEPDHEYPPEVVTACEAIRAARPRTLDGCTRALKAQNWSNS